MACSTCDGTQKVCVVCSQSQIDCNCDEDDIREYIQEEELDADLFEQFIPCEECEDD